MKNSSAILATVLVAALAMTACKKKEETPAPAPAPAPATPAAPAPTQAATRVLSVELGKGLADDKRVAEAVTTFATGDTIHASVNTAGDGTGKKLAARWTFQDGAEVHQESVDMQGSDSIYAFKISNANPWPVGNYKVEISLDGTPVQTREFSVK